MKKLIIFAVVVSLAVLVTVLGINNTGKVAVFLPSYRIDFSLNFAIALLVFAAVGLWFLLAFLGASFRVPSRVKRYLERKRHQALLKANTNGLIAYMMGDEVMAERALKSVSKTDEFSELAYFLRAMSALQADRFDVVDELLTVQVGWKTEYSEVINVLKARVGLARHDFALALDLLQGLPKRFSKFPQVVKIRLFALIGLKQWPKALKELRAVKDTHTLNASERDHLVRELFEGLTASLENDLSGLMGLAKSLTAQEKMSPLVLKPVCRALMQAGQAETAQKLLEVALEVRLDDDLLQVYRHVATFNSSAALAFVDELLSKHPDHILLLEVGAEVCELEQLWGKSISKFEKVYARQGSAGIASKLERLYDQVNQPEKAAFWRNKLQAHLGLEHSPS